MRWFLGLWFVPLGMFWGWHFASKADVGLVFFTRQVHDQTYGIYGHLLGIDPAIIPGMVAKACVIDSLIVGAIYAFARRKRIVAWIRERRAAAPHEPLVPSEASLSSAP